MDVASVHSKAEDEAIVHLMGIDVSAAWFGGLKCKAETNKDAYTSEWKWADVTPYDYTTYGKYGIKDGLREPRLVIQSTAIKTGPRGDAFVEWSDRRPDAERAAICTGGRGADHGQFIRRLKNVAILASARCRRSARRSRALII